MPTLTIDVTAGVATRIQEAYGVSTLQQLKQAIIQDIKTQVVGYETNKASADNLPTLDAAKETYQNAIAQAKASAESGVVLT
jgi:hypothetical protein